MPGSRPPRPLSSSALIPRTATSEHCRWRKRVSGCGTKAGRTQDEVGTTPSPRPHRPPLGGPWAGRPQVRGGSPRFTSLHRRGCDEDLCDLALRHRRRCPDRDFRVRSRSRRDRPSAGRGRDHERAVAARIPRVEGAHSGTVLREPTPAARGGIVTRLTKRDSRATEAQLRAAGVGEPAIALYLGIGDAEDVAAPPTKPSRTFSRIRPSPAGQWKFELPWSCLVSDNHRHSRIASHGKAYKAAREKARELAREQW